MRPAATLRKADRHDDCAGGAERVDRGIDGSTLFAAGRHPWEIGKQAETRQAIQPGDRRSDSFIASESARQYGAIVHVSRKDSQSIQRRAEQLDPAEGQRIQARLESDHSAVCCGPDDGTVGLGANCSRNLSQRNSRSRSRR